MNNTIKPINILKNFKEFNIIILTEHNNIKYKKIKETYEILKAREEDLYVQTFIDDLINNCKKLKYDTELEKMIDTFKNFSQNYLDNIPSDHLSLQKFTCMLSDILKNLTDNILDFNNSYGFNFEKLYQIYDPTIPLDIKINHVKSALTSDFISRTIFDSTSTIKYIAKGANGGVNLINIKNKYGGFNLIEKYMLDDSNPLNNLFEIIREYIIGTQILMKVRPYTPNFVTVHAMYISYDSIEYKFNSKKIVDYLNTRDTNLKSIVLEYGGIGYYNQINDYKKSIKNIANIDTDNQKLYMITEFSPGITFSQFIKTIIDNDDISKVNEIISILLQIFRSIIFAHSLLKYVHNDLHCSNILITEQTKNMYVPELISIKNKTHNSQKINYLAQIIDYGYSSIENYVNYNYSIFSDQYTTVHTDIIRIYTHMMKHLDALKKNDTSFTICKYITVFIGSYYFKDLNKYTMNTNLRDFENVINEYDNSRLLFQYEYLPPYMNIDLINKKLDSGYQFYEYFIDKLRKSPDNLYQKVGLSNISPQELYNFNKLEKEKSVIPSQDFNIENILNQIQPEGLTNEQYSIITKSFDDFLYLCDEVEIAYNTISNLENKIEIVIGLLYNVVNFSKYIGLNTLLIYYSKKSNIIPPELSEIFDYKLNKMKTITINLYGEINLSSLPIDYVDKNLKILQKFDVYFTIS